MNAPDFKRIWEEASAESPFPVPPNLAAPLAAYRDELAEWNKKINLIRYADDRELAVRHFLDSLAGLGHLGDAKKIADLGSGAGFPGMVVALARPDLSVTLIESTQKKANFLRHVRRVLDLANVTVEDRRAEELPAAEFDAVLGRAAAKPLAFIETAKRLVRNDGRVLLWMSPNDERLFTADPRPEFIRYILPNEKSHRVLTQWLVSELKDAFD